MRQKRIMVLGGNIVQAEATLTAKRLGYYTISTDLHPENPGHAIADEYCPVDIIDREAVLREARRLEIDGIVPYTSDILAPVASYVAESLSLPGNPHETVEIMTHKNRFREFLASHGFLTPQGRACRSVAEAVAYFRTLDAPAMLKPVDNAGSKGVFRIDSEEEIRLHWDETMGYSLEKTAIVEQFIERQGLQQDGDIFVIDGRIAFWGVGDQYKDPIAPYMPAMYSFPSVMQEEYRQRAQEMVQEALTALGFRQGPCNVEYIVDTKGDIYILEIGPRNGGNLIPFGIQECTGLDLTELTVRQAVGEKVEIPRWHYEGVGVSLLLHVRQDGVFHGVTVAEKYCDNVRRKYLFRHEGDVVKRFHNGGDVIGSMTFRFDNHEEMQRFMVDENAIIID